MGLPSINISFVQKAQTAVRRSENGVVLLLIEDETKETTSYSYAYAADVDSKEFSAENLPLIKMAFEGGPKKVLIERVTAAELEAGLKKLTVKEFNWLACIGETITTDVNIKKVATWITEQRKANKTFKAVLPQATAEQYNDAGIVAFATDGIVCGAKTYKRAEFCPRIAGILAGMPMTRSATYYTIPEASAITEAADPAAEIKKGSMILINDGENVRIASGNNSYHILTDGDTEDLQSIKIIEGMDMIRDDIRTTFRDNYIGLNNSYDNKSLFVGAVRQYFSELMKQGVLYDEYNNTAEIDVDAQRAYLATKYDVTEMTDEQILTANTGKNVYVRADVQFTDAIENLTFVVTMS